ncbi:hypothetical protein B9Z55_008099 [Caenorhabditis nigoni]|nr:hypothetical protein B9Z55_008099 [Caenorhabditis nigoni]
MVTVWGAPEPYSSYPLSVRMGISWDDCVQDCFSVTFCILAYGNSSLLCALYNIGDVRKIRNDKEASEALEKVSFKFETTKDCPKEHAGMFDGVLTTFNGSLINSSQIITSEYFYTFKYVSSHITDCGMQFEPEIDCSDCDKTMMIFRAKKIEFVSLLHKTARTWYNCVLQCSLTNWCFAARMSGASMTRMDDTLPMEFPQNCFMYKLDELQSFERIEDPGPYPVSGYYSYMTIKFSSSICPGTYTFMFSGSHESNFGYFTRFSSYTLTTTGSQTAIEFKYQKITTCEGDNIFVLADHPQCYGFYRESVPYSQAAQRCKIVGGDGLMAIPSEAALKDIHKVKESILPDGGFYFVGLTRADENSDWEWTLPDLMYDQVVYNMSAENLKGPGLYASLDFTGYNTTLRAQK